MRDPSLIIKQFAYVKLRRLYSQVSLTKLGSEWGKIQYPVSDGSNYFHNLELQSLSISIIFLMIQPDVANWIRYAFTKGI